MLDSGQPEYNYLSTGGPFPNGDH